MDPQLDPPLPATAEPATAADNAADGSHPPYAEMITAAISSLNEPNGSSKRAISSYVETHYKNLPPTHPELLTQHLKQLKGDGGVTMVKYSYKLPGSAPVTVNGSSNGDVVTAPVVSDPGSVGSKRRPGRPPKKKLESVQAAVPVFAPEMNLNVAPVVLPEAPVPENLPIVQIEGETPVTVKRGRGRPPKQGGVVRAGPGEGSAGRGRGGGRGRGRPRKNVAVPVAPAVAVRGTGRPRGRPRRVVTGGAGAVLRAATGGGVAAAVAGGKRRGRPPKGSEAPAKRQRKVGAKPLGRPRKNAPGAPSTPQGNQLQTAYLDIKGKLEHLQSSVRQKVNEIRPFVNNETAVTALQELEALAAVQSDDASSSQPQPTAQMQS